ncbi:MAG: hypothetical protein Q9160_005508 [Pyrenula sp. 1 TL-2023]
MPPKPKSPLNVHSFPRPPLLEKTPRHLQITWSNTPIATTSPSSPAYWVLETTHPPTYYLLRSSLSPSAVTLTRSSARSTMCEWKGMATYWDIEKKADAGGAGGEGEGGEVKGKIWSYEDPTEGFRDIKGYLCFYASGVPWECWVDDEKVQPQEGDFYGGWVTSELVGRMKGGPGTWGW